MKKIFILTGEPSGDKLASTAISKLRKNYSDIDVKIGKLLSNFLGIKKNIKNIITVSQSFQSIFKGMFPNAILYDYQHGIISSKYYGYIDGNSVAEHILNNQSNVLLYGKEFKKKL